MKNMKNNFRTRLLAITDLETTGINHEEHEIIEIGLLLINQTTLKILDTLDVKILPQHIETASEKALEINGYNKKDWTNAIPLKEAMKLYSKKTSGAMLGAWNDSFEYRFLREAFRQTGIEDLMDYHRRDIYTFALEVLRYTDLNKENMNVVAEFLGLGPEPEVHRAINGAVKAYEVYKYLRNVTGLYFEEISKKIKDE